MVLFEAEVSQLICCRQHDSGMGIFGLSPSSNFKKHKSQAHPNYEKTSEIYLKSEKYWNCLASLVITN